MAHDCHHMHVQTHTVEGDLRHCLCWISDARETQHHSLINAHVGPHEVSACVHQLSRVHEYLAGVLLRARQRTDGRLELIIDILQAVDLRRVVVTHQGIF